jgi:hypothetical protein
VCYGLHGGGVDIDTGIERHEQTLLAVNACFIDTHGDHDVAAPARTCSAAWCSAIVTVAQVAASMSHTSASASRSAMVTASGP